MEKSYLLSFPSDMRAESAHIMEGPMKKYIAEAIGDDYLHWQPGDSILLSAPTGSGKTTFVLKNLLPYCASRGEKILYLVNRRVLKLQIENELKEINPSCRLCIDVELYQNIEKIINNLDYSINIPTEYCNGYVDANNNSYNSLMNQYLTGTKFYKEGYYSSGLNTVSLNKYSRYSWVICDECHYFCTDSNYNTQTISSYQFIQRYFIDKYKIYISATIDEIKACIEQDVSLVQCHRTNIYDLCVQSLYVTTPNIYHRIFVYESERNYDHINIEVIGTRNQIAKLVTSSNKKWLVFVDNIEFGKKLKREIEAINNDKEEQRRNKNLTSVAFITADYTKDPSMVDEVGNIVNENKQNAKVLIATSVLDNGINLKDGELRDIIIIADNETEFIQMLGRRRDDGQMITVYLYKYDREHFRRRLVTGRRRYEIAFNYYKKLERIVNSMNYNASYNFTPYINEINLKEYALMQSEHKVLLKRLLNDKVRFEDVKTIFYENDGYFRLNRLSMFHLLNLNNHYDRMIKLFDDDEETAFYKEQLRWLRKSEDLLEDAMLTSIERSQKIIIESLEREIINNEKEKPFTI